MSGAIRSRIQQASSGLAQARELMLAPSEAALRKSWPYLEASAVALQEACFSLTQDAAPHDAGLRDAVTGLQRQVREAKAMVAGIATHYDGWIGILGAMAGGYTVAGGAASLEPRATLSAAG